MGSWKTIFGMAIRPTLVNGPLRRKVIFPIQLWRTPHVSRHSMRTCVIYFRMDRWLVKLVFSTLWIEVALLLSRQNSKILEDSPRSSSLVAFWSVICISYLLFNFCFTLSPVPLSQSHPLLAFFFLSLLLLHHLEMLANSHYSLKKYSWLRVVNSKIWWVHWLWLMPATQTFWWSM